MYCRFSLALLVFLVMLSTATQGLADCDPAAIAGKWNIVTWFSEDGDESGAYTGLKDCAVRLNSEGNVQSILCVEQVPGELIPGDPSNLTGTVLGRFKLSESCRITGELVERGEGELEFIHIRGSASRDVLVMHGTLHANEDDNSIDIFTGTKR